jgi:hypothetical protein
MQSDMIRDDINSLKFTAIPFTHDGRALSFFVFFGHCQRE